MNGLIEAVRARPSRLFIGLAGVALATGALLRIGQPVAALLAPLIIGLLVELRWRDRRALALARRLAHNQAPEKIEVPSGAWGELARAVNHVQQQRRLEQRLQVVAAVPLPEDALQAILDGEQPSQTDPRVVTVLLVSCGDAHRADPRQRHELLEAWQALARAAQEQARAHGALLQPCGDALLLAFGAFTERTADASAQAALQTAESLRQTWECRQQLGAPLALSIASGTALIAMLPGLGYCVLGAPVDQALTLGRLALGSPAYRLLCDEGAYFALRRNTAQGWSLTDLRLPGETGKPQPVYGRG